MFTKTITNPISELSVKWQLDMTSTKHLRKVGQTFFVRMGIPKDVRPAFGGKVEFVASTKKRDELEANAVAAPILLQWGLAINRVRGDAGKPLHDQAARLASEYHRYRGKPLDAAQADLLLDIMDFTLTRVSGLTFDSSLAALRSSLPERANRAFARITGNATPFNTHIAAWSEGTYLIDRASYNQVKSDIDKFSDAHPEETLESLTGATVQIWIDGLLKTQKPTTVRRKLSSLRGYWKWLTKREILSLDAKNPFEGREVKDSRSKLKVAQDRRQRFEPPDVLKLIVQAETDGDGALANMIRLAAYTGIRREGLITLTAGSLVVVEGIPCLHVEEKSEAGIRDVPLHPDILPLIERLSKSNTYLIPCSAEKRGDAMGKRFSRMKTKMGFDEHYTFHSIRHTVVLFFRKSGCRLDVQNQIIGHENDSVQAGYGGHVDMADKLEWILKASKYPKDG